MAKNPASKAPETNREKFIRELAKYLVGDQVSMSIRLEVKDPMAIQWARLRALTPLLGYPSQKEAELVLTKFLTNGP